MTVEKIAGKNPARKANKAVADSAKKRAEAVVKMAKDVERQKTEDIEDAEITKRVLEQEANDRLAEIGHEVAQLNYVLNGTPAPTEPAPEVEPEPIEHKAVEKEVPDPEMERKLQEESDRANEAERQLAEVQRQLEDCELSREPEEPTPEMAPEPEPTNEVEEAPEAEEPTQVAHRVIDVRHWSWLQWLVAFIGLVLALIIFSQWPGWAARNIESEAGAVIVNLFWFAGHAGVGLFGGGWLGSLLENEDDDS